MCLIQIWALGSIPSFIWKVPFPHLLQLGFGIYKSVKIGTLSETDEAPMLYIGEILGKTKEPKIDIAVDPLDGTKLGANDQPNAISVISISE